MIPPLWRKIQRTNFIHLDSLCSFLELNDEQSSRLLNRPRFALNLPLRLAQKIEKGTLEDPILRQFVPLSDELQPAAQFISDPVADTTARRTPKLLHKYHGRALLLTSSACAMHCRYCFRQQFPYETENSSFSEELAYLTQDQTIHEVILSGGDPLSLSHDSLSSLFASLSQIPHLKRIRFHTRFPIGIPERIDKSLLNLLAACPKQIIFILHCNHAKELDSTIFSALRNIQQLGIPILNQSVLLKGVNDEENSLLSLCETLIDHNILPYYLHLLDRVTGSAHFEVPEERGTELISYLQKHLPGYGIPRLVREEAGKSSKTFVNIKETQSTFC